MYNFVHNMNSIILNKGKEKILECFYRNRNKELYFSEILRETKLTQNTTLKHLRSLEENQLVIRNKKIGNTFYKINKKNVQVYSLLSYFDYKIFNELPNSKKRAILNFLESLETKPLIALVFGSTAKKTFTKISDIDILLVFNKKEAKHAKIRSDIEAITGEEIQEFIIDYEYFKEQIIKQDDSVITHAIKTGFVLSGHYCFYNKVLL